MTGPHPAEAGRRAARRRARIADAARLLPVLGIALFFAPDLILSGEAGIGATAPWLLWLFVAWAVLIGLAALVSRAHLRMDPRRGPESDDVPARGQDGGR